MVPKGWLHKTVGDICHFVNGNGFKSSEWDNKGLPIIRIQNLNGSADFNYFNGEIKEKWLVNTGDILFAWAGTKGVSFGAKRWLGPQGVLNQHIFRVEPLVDVDKEWLYLALLKVTQRVEEMAHGFKATLLHVQKGDITDQVINIPPLPEQNKIAQILSTWDQAIATTERLLDLARQQKKALMQQLLTGKKRLLDKNGVRFNQAWAKKPLDKLGEVISGLTYSPADVTDESGTLVLRSSNIKNGCLSFEDNVYVSCSAPEKSITRENDILLCVRNGSRNLIGKSALLHGSAVGCFHGAFMSIFRAKEPIFIFQLFQSNLFYREVAKNLGATINSINGSDLKQFSFTIPTDQEERSKIAAVLSAADQQIETLQSQLDGLKQEKKALMQALLTGKRRVSLENTEKMPC